MVYCDFNLIKSNSTNALKNFYQTKLQLIEKLNFFDPSTYNNINLFNLKKKGTDILEYRKKLVEKESHLKEKEYYNGKLGNLLIFFTTLENTSKTKETTDLLAKKSNILMENQMEKKRSELIDKCDILKNEKESVCRILNELQNEIVDLVVSIDFIENFENLVDDELLKIKLGGYDDILAKRFFLVKTYAIKQLEKKFTENKRVKKIYTFIGNNRKKSK